MAIDCGRLKKGKKLVDAIEYWANDKETLKHIKDPYEAALRLFERDFYVPLEYAIYDDNNSGFLTNGRIQMFATELYKLNDRIKSGDISLKGFWTGSALGKKDPAVGYTIGELQKVSNNDRKRLLETERKVNDIFQSLKIAGGIDGVWSKAKYESALKKYRKLDLDLIKALDRADNVAITDARKAIADFTKKSPLKIFDDFINIIENQMPVAIQEKYDRELRLSKDESLSKKQRKIHSNNVKAYDGGKLVILKDSDYQRFFQKEGLDKDSIEAVIKYNSLMYEMYGVLEEGINKRIKTVLDQVKRNKGRKSTETSLEELRKRLIADIMPKYKEDGYFPHYVRDLNASYMDGLMPHFERFEVASDDFINKKPKDIDAVIEDINKWITNHAKSRNKKEKLAYSRNFIDVVKGYVDDVNRFNTTAFMDDILVNARNKVQDIYKGGKDSNYARNVSDLIVDLHQAANGNTNMSEGGQAIMRSLLAFEFTSKIGINPRSAVRNATQRLLDFVQFGRRINKVAMRELEQKGLFGDDVESQIENILRDAGLLFEDTTPELLESTLKSSPSLYKLRTIDENGQISYNKESSLSKFAGTTSKIAGYASILHRKVENSNRKHTFKIAFGQMHNLLRTSTAWQTKMAERYEKLSDKERESNIKVSMEKIASNYAKNMVISNHFDYGDYAKAKFMRKDIGRFMFQFQHYSMEFLEKNISIAKETSGDWSAFKNDPDFSFRDAEGLHKATRMAIAYFSAPVILGALLGTNFENLIEHDTWDRIKQWATLFTGDEEEVKKAFHGKGALISTFGGALLGDILDIGVSLDVLNADFEGMTDMLIGIDRYTNDTNLSDSGRKIKILNTFAQRAVDRHIPMLMKGHIGMAGQQELGLYPRKEDDNIWKKVVPELFESKKKKSMKGTRNLPFGVYQSLKRMEKEAQFKGG